MAYIYKITNDINEKSYIGKTLFSIEERFKQHCKASKKESLERRHLYNAMRKYGVEHFHIEQVEKCSDNIVNEIEKYWIEYFDTFNNGYNDTLGGDGRSYIDYDLVVENYFIFHNQLEVAKTMGIAARTVRYILKERGVNKKDQKETMKEKYGKKVSAFNKETNEFVREFSSYGEAAQWLIDNNLTKCKFSTIRAHISEVVRGKRRTAAGFFWK